MASREQSDIFRWGNDGPALNMRVRIRDGRLLENSMLVEHGV